MIEPQQDVTGGGDALERFSVVVIGGGPTGLATGYDLSQRGVDFVILERGGRLGEHWRPGWDPTRMFTPARFAGLPGSPFQGEGGWSRKIRCRSISSSTQSDSVCPSDSGLMFSVYRRVNTDESWSSASTADLSQIK
jgi:flavin-dependent dehydrogenase